MPARPPSLAAIAAVARVSGSTVSRALNDNPALPAATRTRIKRIAARLGYRRNRLVSEVMRRARTNSQATGVGNIGYLTFGPEPREWRRDATFLSFFEGARNRARELGYQIEDIWAAQPGLAPERLAGILHARGITGVVIGPSRSQTEIPPLDWAEFAPVKVGVPVPALTVPCACHHHYRAMRQVLDELQARGYRRPGLALPRHVNVKTAGLWAAPFALVALESGGGNPVPPLVETEWSDTNFVGWVSRHKPDAIIALHDDVRALLQRGGRRVPRDVGLVCLDRGADGSDASGIDQRPQDVGSTAIDLVINRLLTNERGIPPLQRTILIDGTWVEGATLRPRGN